MNVKPETAVKTVFLCGALALGGSTASFVNDIKQQKPETFIAADGHAGVELTASQSANALGAVAGGTVMTVAAMFGAALRKEKERDIIRASKVQTR